MTGRELYLKEAHRFVTVSLIDYFAAYDEPEEKRRRASWERVLLKTAIDPNTYEALFGKRTGTREDGDGRRLSMWRVTHSVGDRGISFWLFAHKDRGSSMEIQEDASSVEVLACVKFVHGRIIDTGLLPAGWNVGLDEV
jgi:hypothetical protein